MKEQRGMAMIYRIFSIVVIMGLLFFCSCVTHFKLIGDGTPADGSSIAVIAGLNDEPTVSMALFITESLKKHSRFTVLEQREIGKKIPFYPVRIRGPWELAYVEIDEDYSKTDMKKIMAVQSRVGADYLYIVWVATGKTVVGAAGSAEELSVITQLFKFPEGREVGRGKFPIVKTEFSGLAIGGDQFGDSKKEIMIKTCDFVAKMIAEKTKMLK